MSKFEKRYKEFMCLLETKRKFSEDELLKFAERDMDKKLKVRSKLGKKKFYDEVLKRSESRETDESKFSEDELLKFAERDMNKKLKRKPKSEK